MVLRRQALALPVLPEPEAAEAAVVQGQRKLWPVLGLLYLHQSLSLSSFNDLTMNAPAIVLTWYIHLERRFSCSTRTRCIVVLFVFIHFLLIPLETVCLPK